MTQYMHEEGFVSSPTYPGGDGEPCRSGTLLLFGSKSGVWQAKMDEESKQYMTFTIGNLRFFECKQMPFGLSNAPATFQSLMQNCFGELNLTYCLTYLDDVIVFSKIEEEHLHCL